jgi:hypothetical protein
LHSRQGTFLAAVDPQMSSVGVLGSGYLDARHRIISPRLDTLDEPATGGITTDTVWAGPRFGRSWDGGRPRAPKAVKAAGRESCSGRSDDGRAQALARPPEVGLLYVPKVSATPSREALIRSCLAADALGLRFPRTNLVASATALFERTQPWAHGADLSARNRIPADSGSRWAPA